MRRVYVGISFSFTIARLASFEPIRLPRRDPSPGEIRRADVQAERDRERVARARLRFQPPRRPPRRGGPRKL